MADGPSKLPKFWSATSTSPEHASLVPGVNDVGNRRPAKTRINGGKTKEVKASIPVLQPVTVESVDGHGRTSCSGLMSTDISTIGTDISRLQSKGVTLKDLCADDKKRIANLIKELAKVGEEKENAEQNLSEERQHYQTHIMTLVQQQESILKEREDVQHRLLEYQSYIVNLQQQQQMQRLVQHQERQQRNKKDGSHTESQQGQFQTKKRHDGNADSQKMRLGTFQPPLTDVSDEEEESNAGEKRSRVEHPSVHLYMNESVDQSDDLNGLSTQVVPSQSPSSGRPLPHRPFTALIDRELCEERKKAKMAEEAVLDVDIDTNENNDDSRVTKQKSERVAAARDGNTDVHINDRRIGMDGDDFCYETKRVTKISDPDERNTRHQREMKSKMKKEADTRLHPEEHHDTEGDDVLPSGAAVSPEKMEIFYRFMDSQSKTNTEKFERRRNDDRVEESEGKTRRRKKNNGDNDRKGSKHKSSRRPPPPSFAGFYPPIMSSTQKSSEIGDFVSITDSTINSEAVDPRVSGVFDDSKKRVHRKNDFDVNSGAKADVNVGERATGNETDDDNRDVIVTRRENYRDNNNGVHHGRGGDFNNNNNKNNNNNNLASTPVKEKDRSKKHLSSDRRNGSDGYSNEKSTRSRVDFMEGDDGGEENTGVDAEFLCYYKKLSASERKRELLKQRAMLLEEQNKLKQLLTQHQEQEVKRQSTLEKRGHGKAVMMEWKGGETPHSNSKGDGRMAEDGLNSDFQSDVIVSGHGLKKGRLIQSHDRRRVDCDQEVVIIKWQDGCDGKTSAEASLSGRMEEAEGETTLKGRDGDECVTYRVTTRHSGNGDRRVDKVVKKLDYSLVSDAEDMPPSPSNLNRKFVQSPSNNDENVASPRTVTGDRSDPSKSSIPSGGRDVGTSISYANIPGIYSDDEDRLLARKVDTVMQGPTKEVKTGSIKQTVFDGKSDRRPNKSHFNESPGDKTLAVLKIINSMPEERIFNSLSPEVRVGMAAANPFLHQTNSSNSKNGNSSDFVVPKLNTNRKLRNAFPAEKNKNRFAQRHVVNGIDRKIQMFMKKPVSEILQENREATVVSKFERQSPFPRIDEDQIFRRRKFCLRPNQNVNVNVDSELEVFDSTSRLRNERMDWYRKIIDDDDEVGDGDDDVESFYEYDEKDDSNLDDIMENLLVTSDVVADRINSEDGINAIDDGDDIDVFNGDENDSHQDVWDFVMSENEGTNTDVFNRNDRGLDFLPDMYPLRHRTEDDDDEEDDDDDYPDCDDRKRFAVSANKQRTGLELSSTRPLTAGGRGGEELEEDAILEDVFFVNQ